MTVCSTSFQPLGRAQAQALGCPDLPIAVVPHPFGSRTRSEINEIARHCADEVARMICDQSKTTFTAANSMAVERAALIEAPSDRDELNRFCHARKWTDGLPVEAPTVERMERMLQHSRRAPQDVVAVLAPAFGSATVERIAINAALAGCEPEYLPLLIAAAEAVAAPEFNLQALQATTHPVCVWLLVNGPAGKRLGINAGTGCLGPGTWANATLGRAMRFILQNIGGAQPGEMDRSTHGQPGKYTMCCAENEGESPWPSLAAERGFGADCSTMTVVGAGGTLSMNSHSRDAADLLRVIARTMMFPASNDYIYAGEPWLIVSPEHAQVLSNANLSKADAKRALWEQSKLPANLLATRDYARIQDARGAELGQVSTDMLLPISASPEDIRIIVAGGPGTHSVYIPSFGTSRSVTREVVP